MRLLLTFFMLLIPVGKPTWSMSASDPDSDGDGLSDYQEIHKYFTDPENPDSDADGTSDGDWSERREYTYTVRTVLRVLKPYDIEAMTDDYQDARRVRETSDYLEAEVIHYPLNTNAEAIGENRNWRKQYVSMKEYLRPGVTSNWDRRMQKDLLSALAKAGIQPEQLGDQQAVRQVSRWLMDRSRFEDGFTTFAVNFKQGKPFPAPGMEQNFREELKKTGRSAKQQWDRELFGKGMYENAVRGSCTSSAIYIQTCLRALGIPTRTIICVPAIDASDRGELELIDKRLSHHGLRKLMKQSAEQRGHSWASHTFNEVYVGDRWRRLNYSRLGQNILDDGTLGLMTHVNTFLDHADANLSTWGLRNAKRPDDVFGGSNPYSCQELSDLFGEHAQVENPEAPELNRFEVGQVYWFDDPAKPATVDMRLDDPDSAGHLILHLRPGPLGVTRKDYEQYYAQVDKRFVLRAPGRPEIEARATRGYWLDLDEDLRDFYLRIEPRDFRRMRPGVAYGLEPVVQSGQRVWELAEGIEVIRP